ncbi:MAG: PTS sugar transporter subunit IIA [bacterium]|nr:PTS sugar transporter subunit IIA [bacterium]
MDLRIKDISSLLKISEKDIMRLIKRNEIPFYRINKQYRFNKGEISEWMLNNRNSITGEFMKLQNIEKPAYLAELIKSGGIYYDIEGTDIKSVLSNAINLLPLSKRIESETLLSYLVEREETIPTYIGMGAAVPHPKKPIITDADEQFVAICFLKNPFPYGEKKEMLCTLFIIISSNQRNHLKTLSLISYLMQDRGFSELLMRRPKREDIMFELEKQLLKEKF